MSNLPYYEQKDIENVKKLRDLIVNCRPSVLNFSEGSSLVRHPGPGLHTHMT